MSNPTETQATEPVPPSPWWSAALTVEEHTELPAGTRPAWLDLVEDALAAAPAVGADTARDAQRADLLAPLQPLLDVTRVRFVAAVAADVDSTVADLHAVWGCVQHSLGRRLVVIAARTLVAALHADRDAGRLPGADSRARFVAFLRRTGGRDALTALLVAHPVLARLLGQTCVQAVEATAELLGRLATDRAALHRPDGLLAGDPGRLVEIELGAGDQHAGGRSVTLLRFADGRRLVYKPRPQGLAARFDDLLVWFTALAPDLAPGRAPVLAGDDYGWMRFVPAEPCPSPVAVDRFYRRQGALLALLYVLDATDVHYENLVAEGEHPVLIDVETLFHPGFLPRTSAGADPARAALNDSVARTAMLPRMLLGEDTALDVSGMAGEPGGHFPMPVPVWTAVGTDRMTLTPGRVPFLGGANRPVLHGVAIGPEHHRDAVLTGFRAAYELLRAHSGELLAPDGPVTRFAGQECRVVVRDTAVYGLLLAEATRPDALRCAADRLAAFAAELAAPTGFEHLPALHAVELADLLAGDVPMFTARTDRRDLHGHGVVLPGLLARSGMDAVRAKIDALGLVDRQEQEWLITASLATREQTAPAHTTPAPRPARTRPAVVPTRPRLLAMARGIGDELIARSRRDATRVNWLGLELVDGRFWSVLPMGAGLAEGYCGTALYLAELGALTGVARYTDAARRAVAGVPALLDSLVAHPELARMVGSGGYHGLGGIAYAVSRLAGLLPDDPVGACLPTAVAAVALADVPGRDGVAEGTAGAVAALLAAHAEHGVPGAAEHAVELAARLAAAPDPGVAGFAAGRDGIRWALRRAAAAGGRTAPATASDPAGAGGSGAVAGSTGSGDPGWCAGNAGIVAALTDPHARPSSASDQAVPPSVTGFLTQVGARQGPSTDHSPCHGDTGVLEALVVLATAGSTAIPGAIPSAIPAAAAAALERATAQLIGAIDEHGPRCGTPHQTPSPGLLSGTAGIGLGLLRAGFPDQIPSVLLLQPGGTAHRTTITLPRSTR